MHVVIMMVMKEWFVGRAGIASPMPDWVQTCEEEDEIVYYVPSAAESDFSFEVRANMEPEAADGADAR